MMDINEPDDLLDEHGRCAALPERLRGPPSTAYPPPPPESTFSTKLSLAEQEEEEMLAALNAQVPPVKGPWSTHEDQQLSVLVQQYGPKRWSLIASKLPGRIGKQVRFPPPLDASAT